MPLNPGSMAQSEHAATIGNWAAVAVICGGTIVGAVALIEWIWPLFWIGCGVFVGGSVLAWRTNMMGSVSEWSPPGSSQRTGSSSEQA